MKISLIIPTNRTSYSAMARIFEAASLDPDKFEVIVRDNSENEEKRAILGAIKSPACRILLVPNRGGYENPAEALREASGDFVFFLADDDWISARGLNQLHSLAIQSAADSSVACLTGAYLIDTSTGTGFLQYSGLDSHEPAKRLASYLEANATNVLYYSAVRRELATFCFAFMESLPYKFSYHDQLMSIFYLALGRVLQVDRVVYHYDLGDWETAAGSLSKDKASYVAAGLPAEFDLLHWLFCALEGAFLLNSSCSRKKSLTSAPYLLRCGSMRFSVASSFMIADRTMLMVQLTAARSSSEISAFPLPVSIGMKSCSIFAMFSRFMIRLARNVISAFGPPFRIALSKAFDVSVSGPGVAPFDSRFRKGCHARLELESSDVE